MSNKLRDFLGAELLSLFEDGEKLLQSMQSSDIYSDYSFVVFPYAKVYEGFLKKLFLQIGAIDQNQYDNERWRVGRALNPQLEKELRHESVYDRIVEHCNGQNLAQAMWEAWKKGRNQVFHFWPGRNQPLSLDRAREIISEIEQVMELALTECKV